MNYWLGISDGLGLSETENPTRTQSIFLKRFEIPKHLSILVAISRIQERSPTLVNVFNVILTFAITLGIISFLVIDSLNDNKPERLFSLLGIFAFVLFGFLISKHPGQIRWRHIVWGLGIGKFMNYSLINVLEI